MKSWYNLFSCMKDSLAERKHKVRKLSLKYYTSLVMDLQIVRCSRCASNPRLLCRHIWYKSSFSIMTQWRCSFFFKVLSSALSPRISGKVSTVLPSQLNRSSRILSVTWTTSWTHSATLFFRQHLNFHTIIRSFYWHKKVGPQCIKSTQYRPFYPGLSSIAFLALFSADYSC